MEIIFKIIPMLLWYTTNLIRRHVRVCVSTDRSNDGGVHCANTGPPVIHNVKGPSLTRHVAGLDHVIADVVD